MGSRADWRDQCNAMDEIWVPSDHNLQSFADAGVDPSKLYKVPETFDTRAVRPGREAVGRRGSRGLRVPVGVLVDRPQGLGRPPARVVHRVQGARRRDAAAEDGCGARAARHGLPSRGRGVRANVSSGSSPARGRASSCSTSISRPRTCRACIAPPTRSCWRRTERDGAGRTWRPWRWDCRPSRPAGAATSSSWTTTTPTCSTTRSSIARPTRGCSGQRWAEPSLTDLQRTMRRVAEHPKEAAATGARARADVLVSCAPEVVATAVRERIEAIAKRSRRRPPRQGGPVARAECRAAAAPAPRRRRPAPQRMRRRARRRAVPPAVPLQPRGGGGFRRRRRGRVGRGHGGGPQRGPRPRDRRLGAHARCGADPRSRPASTSSTSSCAGTGSWATQRASCISSAWTARSPPSRGGSIFLFPRHPDLRYLGRAAEQLLPQRRGLEFGLVPSQVVLHRHGAGHPRHRRLGAPPPAAPGAVGARGPGRAVPSLQPRRRPASPRPPRRGGEDGCAGAQAGSAARHLGAVGVRLAGARHGGAGASGRGRQACRDRD